MRRKLEREKGRQTDKQRRINRHPDIQIQTDMQISKLPPIIFKSCTNTTTLCIFNKETNTNHAQYNYTKLHNTKQT